MGYDLLRSQMMFALVLVILVEPYLSSTSSTGLLRLLDRD